MKKLYWVALFSILAIPAVAPAETFKGVALVDVNCSAKVKADPDAHTRACALQCQKSGFGILTPDGTFLKLDAQGNQQAVQLLSKSRKADHLRANVKGKVTGDTIEVQSISLE
ncbi:MAG: hypothetical protein ACLQOO_22635 [Terriglobia bacterium]